MISINNNMIGIITLKIDIVRPIVVMLRIEVVVKKNNMVVIRSNKKIVIVISMCILRCLG